MKRCPECRRDYYDDSLLYCLEDGSALVQGAVPPPDEPRTAILSKVAAADGDESQAEGTTRPFIHTTASETEPPRSLAVGHYARRWALVVGATVLVFTLAFLGYRYFATSGKQINSIAVLPFENKSTDADTDYLSDGLTDSLIFRLTQMPGLKVSPASSIIRYKGKEMDVAKIAAELGVDAVMTGRLLKRGDDLNITVELVDARDNKSLWGEQYQRKMADLLSTQREIASTIVQKLQVKLTGTDKAVVKKYTDSNDAYDLYLKARYRFARRTKEDIYKSIDLYNEAIKLDPGFALAYTGIAEAYAAIPSYPYASPAECFPRAKAAAEKALELDPELAEAHSTAGGIAATYDWDWARAEVELKRGIELNPDSGIAHFRYANSYLSPIGRHDEALAEMRRAMELEPMAAVWAANYAGTLMYARRYDEAVAQARKTYDLDPSLASVRFWLCRTYNVKGMYGESLAISEASLNRAKATSDWIDSPNIALAYAKTGRRDKALDILHKWLEDEKQTYVMHYWIAAVYVALEDNDAAFAQLEKALQNRDWYMTRIKFDPFMDPLRDDPRFDALVKKLNFPN